VVGRGRLLAEGGGSSLVLAHGTDSRRYWGVWGWGVCWVGGGSKTREIHWKLALDKDGCQEEKRDRQRRVLYKGGGLKTAEKSISPVGKRIWEPLIKKEGVWTGDKMAPGKVPKEGELPIKGGNFKNWLDSHGK